ncbi:HSP90 family protein [Cellulomonas soli]|uniref:Molecular chaperone HtpG n=1 Tax=Cellulomonas soli TaxID=931535 RepID=A0A512PBK3_9CELL|nr:HSP90 family protein [Cellulomonas soli]NYI60996.1 molecular chaperone HtpG [Cellulomonas soli]GEP68589.1 molecular chaperone HtpG [Cellulomonas soli]
MSTTRAFAVDLRGMVDLLARHLYSGPRVYLRELLQNGVDAVTARRALDPGAPATVRIVPGPDGSLEITDSGVGLTLAEAEELLATIGRSSKRDLALGHGRAEFLGQFGIGLLSAFMVAETIELVSRSAREPDAPAVRWRGHDDGTYELAQIDEDVPVGSTVRLRPRRDAEHWLATETVVALAEEFGALLPVDVAVQVPLDDGTPVWRRTSTPELPWRRTYGSDEERRLALVGYCERTLGFTPLAHIDLDVPLAGVSGVAFVLPAAVPAGRGTHRVYVKRMLLDTRVDGLLPDWSFFVRCVLDADGLRPTASREALYEDEVLLATREVLGEAVRRWTIDTLHRHDLAARRFVEAHHLAVRALATTDDTMLDLVADVLPFETTDGTRTLAEVRAEHGSLVHTGTVEEFRRIAPVARAQGLAVVNAGYVYDAELLARLAARHPDWGVRALAAADVAAVLAPLDPLDELAVEDTRRDVDRVLAAVDCQAVLRTFAPSSLPALLLHDRDGDHQRDLARTVGEADDLWGQVLSGFAVRVPPRRLVLNCANPMVTDLLAAPAGDVRDAGVRALYVSALLLAGEPLRTRDTEIMTDALAQLLRAGLSGPGPQPGAPATDRPAAGPTHPHAEDEV